MSAHDMTAGYAIASSVDKRLAPFQVPTGLAETDVAAKLFANFKETCALFTRCTQDLALRRQI